MAFFVFLIGHNFVCFPHYASPWNILVVSSDITAVNGEAELAEAMRIEDKEDPVIIPTLPDQLLDIRPNV